MSTKTFCDQCGKEILDSKERVLGRLTGAFGRIRFKVMTGLVDGPMNSGDFCDDCIRIAVAPGSLFAVQAALRKPAHFTNDSQVGAADGAAGSPEREAPREGRER